MSSPVPEACSSNSSSSSDSSPDSIIIIDSDINNNTSNMPPSLQQQNDNAHSRKTRTVPSGSGDAMVGSSNNNNGSVTMVDNGGGIDNSGSHHLNVGVNSGNGGSGFGRSGSFGVGGNSLGGGGGMGVGNLLSRQYRQHQFNFGGGYTTGTSNGPMQYMARLTDFRQMDIQSALDQMKTLMSTRAHVVYKTSYYRKQTKNHWARDDPAFVAIQAVFLLLASIAYAVAFRTSVVGSVSFILVQVLWNWLGIGIIVATVTREIANRHLVLQTSSSHVRQSVEWLYSFDIHCNAFFPVFVLLYGLQFFLLPLVLGGSFVAFLVSNTLYVVAFAWYWYITHLGYRTLPFLSNTEVFLFPIVAVFVVYVLNLVGYPLGLGWNASRMMAEFYFT